LPARGEVGRLPLRHAASVARVIVAGPVLRQVVMPGACAGAVEKVVIVLVSAMHGGPQ
jgi:hypothetical protein